MDGMQATPVFCCPLCERDKYEPVMGQHTGKPFHTGIYRCTNCRFGFADPARFAESLRSPPSCADC
jgi:hypothetical protein